MLINMEVQQLLGELASESPAPGGGSVAALSGALSAGLIAMVCRLTIGKKGLEEHDELVGEVLSRVDALRNELAELIDLDTEAFNGVMAGFKMAKATEEEKATRSSAIQKAFRNAVDVPLRTARACEELLTLALKVATVANPNCISDLGVAGQSAYAGLRGGVMNVQINLPSIKDKSFVDTTASTISELSAATATTHQDLEKIINQRLL